ncbi:hypothetical protein [Rossellomorea aquimaris]|uniref:Uncharacterized protein n=1 Tax=Rossellomorea aquimaris TaxID=189382 RepID=A0A5D4TNV5_9BACI|nr:hypothetical protein [Rossellomorea aquimaris]TYS75924.1 hypothetical protein FZD05_19560 [Rossellomorea aquimaris]TYS81184.1 hypothetical protein FZC85_20135 [Rossellomorea aquimaris]
MKFMLDSQAFTEKPKGYEIGVLSKRIINNQVDINVEELANELGNGKTFVPATFKETNGVLRRSIENWESQQIFALDFDEGLRLDEASKDEFLIENAVFLYTTFSHTQEQHKFRVVFVLDYPVYEYQQFQNLMNKLLSLYPYADQSCKDGSRLFFGGSKVIPFDYRNRLSVYDYCEETPLQDIKNNLSNMSCKRVQQSQNTLTQGLDNNVQLIKERNIQALQERLNINPVTLSNNEVMDYLKMQDLRTFLGVQTSGNFIDIFHDESNPSASVFQSNKGNGHWLYKCFSSSYPFVGTILHVVEKLLNCTTVQAKKFLMTVYNITVFETEAVLDFKESIDMYKELLRSEELEDIHPHFYKVFNRYGHLMDLYLLLDLTKEYITNESDPRIVFYHSVRTLSSHFGRSISATGTRLNFFTLFNVIYKLDEQQVPPELLEKQNQRKKKNGYQYRSSTYEIPMYTYEFFNKIDNLCKIWIKSGGTSRTISYEGIMRTFGQEEADRVYPQDKGKEIPVLNDEIVSEINRTALQQIEYKGWTTEKEILECISDVVKGGKGFKKGQFKRCIAEMLDAYELELVASNKQIKAEMGITEEFMSKQSFPKVIRRKK